MLASPLAPAPPSLRGPAGPVVPGAWAGELPAPDLAAAAGPGLAGALRRLARAKRWIWAMAASDDVLAAVAVVEAGWFAGGFAWALDRRRGVVLWEGSAAGLPGRHASVGPGPGEGARARLRAGGLAIDVAREGGRWRLAAAGAGGAFALDAALETAGAPAPFALAIPVPGGGVRATQKAAGLRASGSVRAAGSRLSLDGAAGGVDFTAGLLARETSWRWAFATGRPGGAPLGFNLCAGFGVPEGDPGENAGFAGAAPWRLPPVAFAVGDERAPWRVRSAGGEVDLVFRPQGAHREARSLGLLRTRFAQVAGSFEGRLPGPAGEPVGIAGLPGVVEDHLAVW